MFIPQIDDEFKALIPPLSQEEHEQLEQNIIAKKKCYDPIIIWDGLIIDGHNRFEICIKHGIEFEYVQMPLATRDEAKLWILENQLGRRNLNDATRIMVAQKKALFLREKAKKKQSRAGGDKKSVMAKKSLLSESSKPKDKIRVRKAIAAELGISEGNVYYFTQIMKHGSPQLQHNVLNGHLKIGTAYRMLKQHKDIMHKLTQANKSYKFISKCMTATGANPNPEIDSLLENLEAQLYETLCTLIARQRARRQKGEQTCQA